MKRIIIPSAIVNYNVFSSSISWAQDIGYLTDKSRLPITGMRFLKKELSDVSRATLTLGPLECFSSGEYFLFTDMTILLAFIVGNKI